MFSIISFDELTSTNDHLKKHYLTYPPFTVIVTEKQTHGRGRFDRVWESKQDLLFSILFHPSDPHVLLAPLAVVKALKIHGISASIKWPNDIMVDDKKVCGILVETIYEGNKAVADIVGIGVNLSEKSKLLTKACFLTLSKNILLQDILTCYTQDLSKDKEALLEDIKSVSYLDGKSILLDDIIWEVDGIEAHGYLCVHHENQQRVLKSEEITLEAIYDAKEKL